MVSSTYFFLPAIFFIFLLLLLALLSGADSALFCLTADERATYQSSTRAAERRAARLLDNPWQLSATISVVQTFLYVAIATVAWHWYGVYADATGSAIVTVAAALTFVTLIVGEIIPRFYALRYKGFFVRTMTYPLQAASRLVYPFTWLLIKTSTPLKEWLQTNLKSTDNVEMNQSLETVTQADISEEERKILRGIVNFGDISARQIMRVRTDITAFSVALDFHELMDKINKSGYSRVPIYKQTLDHIEGVLYIKDVLPHIDKNEHFRWQQLIRPGYFIPENKMIDDLLRDFQAKRVHMAIVVDEYGGTSGLITMEDILEEIVGEINDEFDKEDAPFTRVDESTYVFEGKTSLNDFCRAMGVDSSLFESVKGESESLGGLLLELFSRFPRAGEKTVYDRFLFTVIAVDQKRIKRIKVVVELSGVSAVAQR